ncbi:MAG TPA: RidA family protein [Stellaceae bacterium]|nr:RidA family protein [Stellaceae bacterium]
MREVIPAPVPGLDLRAEYGHHQSPAIRAGGLIFCSGMVAVDPKTGDREHGTVTSETRRVFENLKLLLQPAGSSLDRLAQVHAMIYDRIEYDVLNRAYRPYVASPPARTVMSVQIEAGFKVMLDVIAAAQDGPTGDFVFLPGMSAAEPGTVAAETRQILTDMARSLEARGSSLAKVVKVNVLIYSMLEYGNMNDAYREFFPLDPPARTVCGAGLIGGPKVQIDCIALA